MPKKLIKYYAEIPNCSNYVLSNYGKVYKKSTWKEISTNNDYVRLTIKGKQTMLSVQKLFNLLFPAEIRISTDERMKTINDTEVIRRKIVRERKNYKKFVSNNSKSNSNDTDEEEIVTKKPKYVYKDNGRGGYVREKVEEVIEYDYQSLPDSVFYNGVPVDKKNLSVRAINKILAEYNKK